MTSRAWILFWFSSVLVKGLWNIIQLQYAEEYFHIALNKQRKKKDKYYKNLQNVLKYFYFAMIKKNNTALEMFRIWFCLLTMNSGYKNPSANNENMSMLPKILMMNVRIKKNGCRQIWENIFITIFFFFLVFIFHISNNYKHCLVIISFCHYHFLHFCTKFSVY